MFLWRTIEKSRSWNLGKFSQYPKMLNLKRVLVLIFSTYSRRVLFISLPEPKACRWAYSIGWHLSSVLRRCHPSSVNIFKRHLLRSRSLPYFTYTSIGGGRNNTVFFCPNRIRTLVAKTTYSCHWLIMGKNEDWHLLPSHFLTKLLQKCSLSGPLPNIPFLL